jgi:hypothetical protein
MNSAFVSLKTGQRRAGKVGCINLRHDGSPKMPRRKSTGAARGGCPSTRRLGCQREPSNQSKVYFAQYA